MTAPKKISDNIYVKVNKNAIAICKLLTDALNLFDLSNELILEIEEKTNTTNEFTERLI